MRNILNLWEFVIPPNLKKMEKLKLTKEDKNYLYHVLNNSHYSETHMDIEKCPMDNCWYKIILKKLGIKKLIYRKNQKQDVVISKLNSGGHFSSQA